MDDRTIIDDDSMRITDVAQAKPGDLMVIGCMKGDVFKQLGWLVITDVHDFIGAISNDGVCIDFSNLELFAHYGSSRTSNELYLVTEESLESTGLYFDCLIRQKQHHKKGIYKNKHNSNVIYFDGNSSFNFLEPVEVSGVLPAETFLDFDQYTLVYAFDEDDDHGEKNI